MPRLGDLANSDYGYSDLGVPIGVPPAAVDPRTALPLWAAQADVMPRTPEPLVGSWPAYKPPKELPDVGAPAIPSGPSWQGNPTANRAADVMGNLAMTAVVPQDLTDVGLMLATGPGRIGYKIAAGALGTVLDPSEVEAGAGSKLLKGIKAYHSSPHDFDKFDLSKIGTGEGAQVYGHGLYFAENPAVSGQGGQYWRQFTEHPQFKGNDAETLATIALKNSNADRARALEYLHKDREGYWKANFPRQFEGAVDLLKSDKPVGPRTYEVNIKADPAQMLDWDKRVLPHQAEAINDTLELRMMQNHPDWRTYMQMQKDIPQATGKEAWQLLTSPEVARMKPPEASQFLQQHDIPGVKYLDEGSRMNATSTFPQLREAPRTSNYVVFDPSIVDIMKKYGIAGAAPAGIGALAAQDYYRNP